MSTDGLNINQKKEWAKTLFLKGDLTQKEIAKKVKVTEKTLSLWASADNWDALRKSLLTSKSVMLSELYTQLELILKENKQLLEDGDPATKPNTDSVIKITKSIHFLESETSISDTVSIGMDFLNFVKSNDLDLAQKITPQFDAFIKSKLSNI